MRPDVLEILDRFRKAGCQVYRTNLGPGNDGWSIRAADGRGSWTNDRYLNKHGMQREWERFMSRDRGPLIVRLPDDVVKQIHDSQTDNEEV